MTRDAVFYLKRYWRRRERKWKRMRPMYAAQERHPYTPADRVGTVEHAWMRQRRPASRWRWRRNRAEVRARSAEHNVSIEIALELIAREFAQWPESWEHKCYFWPWFTITGLNVSSRGVKVDMPGCTCGMCMHGKKTFDCDVCSPHRVMKYMLDGLSMRDVQ